jgi:hypothetical protein
LGALVLWLSAGIKDQGVTRAQRSRMLLALSFV